MKLAGIVGQGWPWNSGAFRVEWIRDFEEPASGPGRLSLQALCVWGVMVATLRRLLGFGGRIKGPHRLILFQVVGTVSATSTDFHKFRPGALPAHLL